MTDPDITDITDITDGSDVTDGTGRAGRRFGVAMVGHAFMGAAHSQAWRNAGRYFALPVEADMTVVAGTDADRAATAAARFGWRGATDDWRSVIDRPDIVTQRPLAGSAPDEAVATGGLQAASGQGTGQVTVNDAALFLATHQVVDLLRDIAEGRPPEPSFADGLAVQRVSAAVQQSAMRESRWQAVPYPDHPTPITRPPETPVRTS